MKIVFLELQIDHQLFSSISNFVYLINYLFFFQFLQINSSLYIIPELSIFTMK